VSKNSKHWSNEKRPSSTTKIDENIANWAVNTSESLSDHKRIEFNLEFDCSRTIESRNYNKANWGLFDSIIVCKTELLDPKIKWDGPRLVFPIR
jgi:hypothetical protein